MPPDFKRTSLEPDCFVNIFISKTLVETAKTTGFGGDVKKTIYGHELVEWDKDGRTLLVVSCVNIFRLLQCLNYSNTPFPESSPKCFGELDSAGYFKWDSKFVAMKQANTSMYTFATWPAVTKSSCQLQLRANSVFFVKNIIIAFEF